MRFFLLLGLLAAAPSLAQISPVLLEKFKSKPVLPCLIYLKDQASLQNINPNLTKREKAQTVFNQLFSLASERQAPLIAMLTTRNRPVRSFYIVNLIWSEISFQDAADLMATGMVKSIVYDSPVSFSLPVTWSAGLTPRSPEITWGLKRMNVPGVWAMGFEGQGVVVGGADTGDKWDVDGIKKQYRGFISDSSVNHNYSWYDAIHDISPLSNDTNNPCGINLKAPCDDHGHGTHTKGTMVGSSQQYLFGVAPKAQWIGCRNMERGNGAPSTYIECFQFFIAPTDVDGNNQRPELAPHVINNSWYCSLAEGCDTSVFPIMERVIINLKTSGIVVVVSAGNDGANCYTLKNTPAVHEASFTVGAFSPDNTISSFSSAGPVTYNGSNLIKPNVCAPGSEVISQLPNGSYASWSGTSMAGPHVAGLVALLISANPALAGKVDLIENIIEETAERHFPNFDCAPSVSQQVPNHVYGHGLIMADAAVSKALLVQVHSESSASSFSISPNPAQDLIRFSFDGPDQTYAIQLINICGTVIDQFLVQPNRPVSVKELLPGIYFFRELETGKTIRWLKL